ncbi:hypothetical protein MVES_000778 [Malassezia vespertilionis]|uniref:Protein kinase domain-containing protein n=1 Tax=Malassezia vespertilionis TaxID=2020962 RepID=A0A2N1JEX6_9BASI|nr:hypothetical protein MVES_000778 [Malassezia vespertilionis]
MEGELPIVNMTERAVQKILSVSEAENDSEIALRIIVEPGGCHGYVYHLEITSGYEEDDFVFVDKGARLVVDSVSLGLVKGSVVDYVTELIGSQFAIKDNPQAKGSGCGCGCIANMRVDDDLPNLPKALKEKYKIYDTILGFGTFAVVKACANSSTGEELAMKFIAREPTRIHDVYESDDAVFVVMDLCRGGELFDSIVERVSYHDNDVCIIMQQILKGVAYLHKFNIVHRDLKPENILLRKKDDIREVAISDFGLAKILPSEGLLLTACGSPQYVAPEVLLGKGYNSSVDVWSCGVIAYALLSGYTPFYSSDMSRLFDNIIHMRYEFHPEYWMDVSDLAKDFIRKCLCDSSVRMLATEALAHPWLAEYANNMDPERPQLKRAHKSMSSEVDMPRNFEVSKQVNGMQEVQRLRERFGTATKQELEKYDEFIVHFKSEPLLDWQQPFIEYDDNGGKNENDKGESSGENSTKRAKRTQESDMQHKQIYTRHYIHDKTSRSRDERDPGSEDVLNGLLERFRIAQRPAESRVDPSVETKPPQSLTLTKALRLVPTILNQGLSIGSVIASHAIYGPPKKSWGVEMSILTRAIRDMVKHSEFATIPTLQKVFDLARFLPVPDEGLITPVTFRVKRRGLRGMLAEADAEQDGKQELTGEWIVGKQTWGRLQKDWQSGKRTGKERVILYIHGGAYFVMSAVTHRPLTIALSKYSECRVFCINYRLAPDTVFPGALHDVASAWFRLTDDLHIPANNIILAADSAGGGLAFALMMYLRDNNYTMPGGAILFSPWVDLTLSCDSWETNKEFDFLPRPKDGDHMHPVAAYLGKNFDKLLTHPYVSPLFGDLHGLPPLLIQTGDAEVLRDENILIAHKCTLAGVPVRHEIYEDCVHVFQFFLFLDASRKALQSARHFLRTALDKRPKRRASFVSADARKQLDMEMSKGMEVEQERPASQGSDLPPTNDEHITIHAFDPSEADEETWLLETNSDSDTEANNAALESKEGSAPGNHTQAGTK